MKKYLVFQLSIGLSAVLFIDWYSRALPKAGEPLLLVTTIAQDLKSSWPVAVGALCWCAFSFVLTRRLFSNQVASEELSDMRNGSESDRAFGFGIIFNVIAILLYMLFRNINQF
ncbi:hypothetical protein OH460_07745 [Vibrio sp. Makdt]|uniref:hypothetical protein n=1 Tax=Vibrio sp. Makdt TaxID=2998828 RepID=UPI0022CD4699|nr:hypothetical protein [Vibrio sp. Makdt]MDA0152189.1 hypothetical protein [Vibrio sp. Makdt]